MAASQSCDDLVIPWYCARERLEPVDQKRSLAGHFSQPGLVFGLKSHGLVHETDKTAGETAGLQSAEDAWVSTRLAFDNLFECSVILCFGHMLLWFLVSLFPQTVRFGVLSWKKGTRRAGWVARGSELGARGSELGSPERKAPGAA